MGQEESQLILPQFLAIEPHFVGKGCAGRLEITILLQFLAVEPHFVRKGCAGRLEITILPQFFAIELHFVRKGCDGTRGIAIFSVFSDRTSFRAKGLHFVASHWHCPAPSREKLEKKEGARGQESKRECEDEKM